MRHISCISKMSVVALLLIGGVTVAQEDKNREGRRAKMRKRVSRDDGAPKIGDVAPTFKLKSPDGKNETDLASFKGSKPVVLFFGSYT